MVSDAKKRAVIKYRTKTYRMLNVKLRIEEDAEVIKALEDAKASGIPYRELILEWYTAYKETHE